MASACRNRFDKIPCLHSVVLPKAEGIQALFPTEQHALESNNVLYMGSSRCIPVGCIITSVLNGKHEAKERDVWWYNYLALFVQTL